MEAGEFRHSQVHTQSKSMETHRKEREARPTTAVGTPDGTDAQAHGAERDQPPSTSAAHRGRWDREALETVLRRRFFFAPAFEIYGGVAGLYDYGPPGCAMKNNLVQMWRQHFVLEEGMLELDGPALTPDPVLRTSGHVDKFQDWMVRDTETAACYRADHLLRDALQARLDDPTLSAARSSAERQDMERTLAHVDELTADELAAALRRFDVRAPDTNNPVSAPYSFNLMFQTQIGPTGTIPAYLRPETAQGMFVNFRRLLDYVGGRMPFACAQIGLAYRNEISPRAGLLRVREFMQAEIEHFVHPERKAHPRFHRVADDVLVLFPRDRQSALPDSERHRVVRMRAGEAVAAAHRSAAGASALSPTPGQRDGALRPRLLGPGSGDFVRVDRVRRIGRPSVLRPQGAFGGVQGAGEAGDRAAVQARRTTADRAVADAAGRGRQTATARGVADARQPRAGRLHHHTGHGGVSAGVAHRAQRDLLPERHRAVVRHRPAAVLCAGARVLRARRRR
eukprot:ctg_70.g29